VALALSMPIFVLAGVMAQYCRLFEQEGRKGTENGRKVAEFSATTASIHLVPGPTHRITDVVLSTTSGKDVRLTDLQS
jgi:hypothetical protein